VTTKAGAKRRYDNTLRSERANETRARIVDAGAQLLRQAPIRDWHGVTIRAVAERAGVNERTVYRHFANERALRDAVMHQLEQAVGIDLSCLRLGDVGDAAGRILRHVASYPHGGRPVLDPTLAEAGRRQREALLAAVEHGTQQWSTNDRTLAAAVLDLFWAVGSYERLVGDWNLEPEEAIRGIRWVVGLVEDAIGNDERPPRPRRAGSMSSNLRD
jgi:AcrR family transcriptional regulator